MDARDITDEDIDVDGQAVWSWLPDAGVKPSEMIGKAMVANKPGTPGRARSSRKPLRRECRSCRRTCTDLWASFPFSPRGLRVRPAPGIPFSLLFRGSEADAKLGQIMPRECEGVPHTPSSFRGAPLGA